MNVRVAGRRMGGVCVSAEGTMGGDGGGARRGGGGREERPATVNVGAGGC